jgi:hypothetical protein
VYAIGQETPKNHYKCISIFFRSKTPYKMQDEVQKLFFENLMLLTAKGCEHVDA